VCVLENYLDIAPAKTIWPKGEQPLLQALPNHLDPFHHTVLGFTMRKPADGLTENRNH